MSKITAQELSAMSASMYGDMVKAVVDLKKKLLIVDAEMHVDEEQFLLESGSKQEDLWELICIQTSLAQINLSNSIR